MIQNKLSRYKIKKIIEYFCIDIEATKTAYLVRLNRNTVNRYYNIFRQTIFDYQTREFNHILGTVEADESYFGPRRARGIPTKRGRGTHRQPVFGIYERGGRVYTEIVPNCNRKTLRAIIVGKIDPKSILHTDQWSGYDGLVDVGYDKHYRVNHGKRFRYKRACINGIEAFWSFTKRRLSKFNGYKRNFHLHLKESEWRWNKKTDTLIKELMTLISKKQD
ncbi:IS1595 family transposase [PVC group bacterium]|nr:IS1595 family transposase [PVC group bacterium]